MARRPATPDEPAAYWAALHSDPAAALIKWADRTANLWDLPWAAPAKRTRYLAETHAVFIADATWPVPPAARLTLTSAWAHVVQDDARRAR
jgi:hypothetical protein